MRPFYCKGLCRACYHRPYGRALYRRKKADPEWYARFKQKVNESKRRKREQKVLAELGRLTADLEDLL